jgi:hypothetical protein
MEPLRVGFFLDGYTLKKVNEYYRNHHRFRSQLDFRSLKSWVQMQSLKYFEAGKYRDLELEAHYYHPYRNPHIYREYHKGSIRLQHELEQAGYSVHFNPTAPVEGTLGPNMALMEDALLFAVYRKLDAVVLFSTQGQFAPLPSRLGLMGVPTLLLGWSFVYPKAKRNVYWKTDPCLRDRCAHYVAMEKVVDRTPNSKQGPSGFFFQCEHPFERSHSAPGRKS